MQHQVRETPVPEPLQCGLEDPSRPDVGPNSARPEPVLAIDNIQGNIIAGFNKDHQTLLFLKIVDVETFKQWLKSQIPFIATAAEVLAFNRLFKHLRTRRRSEPTGVKATWFNIAFSFNALAQLSVDADEFTDQAFKDGLAERSRQGILGDPINTPNAEGNPNNWVIGGPNNEADVILIVASDDRSDMLAEINRLEDSIAAFRTQERMLPSSGAEIIFKDEGANLPPPLGGHEHFGFLDGVSQPGVRGRISTEPHDVLTLRQNPNKRDQPPEFDQQGKRIKQGISAQGKPGQDLLWSGEFVFGYQSQNPNENDDWDGPNPDPVPLQPDQPDGTVSLDRIAPAWAKDGSFLVFRRLRQDVAAFHSFLRSTAQKLAVPDPQNSSAAKLVGARLVGRWPSGAPVLRAANDENPQLADDDCTNNNFEFDGNTDPLPPPNPQNDPFACSDQIPNSNPPQNFDPSPGDRDGLICPFTGHIRKAYPRDDKSIVKNDIPDPPGCKSRTRLNESDTQTHRLLRRGIPYGPVSRSTPDAPFEDNIDRGLHFLAYQTSIVDQFEFVTKCWINNPNFKEPSDQDGNPAKRGGYDPIIGQNEQAGEGRIREFTVTFKDPTNPKQTKSVRVSTKDFAQKTGKTDWVIPTGGGYFFSPSIQALEETLST